MGALTNAAVVIAAIGVIIFVHELGHFLLARWNKVEVLEFAIGFGPKLWAIRRGGTQYSLRIIPFGGYVRMSGDDRHLVFGSAKDREGEDGLDRETLATLARPEGWFLTKGYFAKCGIVLAGPLFNVAFAFVLAIISFATFGGIVLQNAPIIGDVQPGYPAAKAGIQPGDTVISIDGTPIDSWFQIAKTVRGSGGKDLSFVLSRKGDTEGTPQTTVQIQVQPIPDSSELEVMTGVKTSGHVIGIAPSYSYEPMPKGEVITAAASQVWNVSVMTVRGFWGLLSGRVSRKNVGGPILMFQEASRSAKRGSGTLLNFMIFINVTLAILNLLPIPVLDGGHLVIFSVEAIKGSALSLLAFQRLTTMGMLFLLSLMALALTNDLGRVFGM